MRRLIYILLVLVSFSVYGQEDSGKPIPLESGKGNSSGMPKISPLKQNKKNPLEYNKEFKIELEPQKRKINMLPNNNLVQAGAYFDFDPKVGPRENEVEKEIFGDMFLGNIKVYDKFVGVVCRDHQIVDGDRVKILHNGEVVLENFYLSGAYKGVNIDLVKGYNTIEFVALNQGSSGPNTAELGIYDSKGNLLKEGVWNLSTGSKGTLVVIRE